jgi:transposase
VLTQTAVSEGQRARACASVANCPAPVAPTCGEGANGGGAGAETWAKTNIEPLRGWALRGERLVAKVPHGHWKTMTFVASLRHDRIEAP